MTNRLVRATVCRTFARAEAFDGSLDRKGRALKECFMAQKQKMYKARIIPAAGGQAIEVTVPANDPFQARKVIEGMYGPVKSWFANPVEVR